MGSAAEHVGSLLAPADWLRRGLLKALGRLNRPLMQDRELRVMVMGITVLCSSLLLALFAPLWTLALGPIVLGVPHVLSDIRYLVVRPGLHRRRELAFFVVPPLVLASLGMAALGSVLACLGLVLATWRWTGRSVTLGLALCALVWCCVSAGPWADVFFAHAHNVVGVLVWWLWRPRRPWQMSWVLVGFVLITAWLLAGPLPWLGNGPAGGDAETFRGLLAPGVASAWGTRLVAWYVFAQGVHYGVWLRLIPDDDRPRHTPRSFAASWHALVSDMGAWVVMGGLGCAAGVALWACVDLMAARTGYLALASFHGGLELITLTLWMLREPHAARMV